jgi:hypothetical protein
MDSRISTTLVAFVALFALSSCSGMKNACTVNCNPTGNANVTVSILATPSSSIDLLSFTLPIVGISLTNSAGTDVSIFSAATAASLELTRLQADSSLITNSATVPADTYTAIKVTVTTPAGVFINTSGATIGTCVNGAVCNLTGGAASTISSPISLTLSANGTQWIGLNFNLNNATTSTGTISLTNANILSASTTPRTGIPSGSVDTIEDFTGVVLAYSSGTSITVQSAMNGATIIASLASSPEYDTPTNAFANCGGTVQSCITVGSTVSIDALLAANGTLTATEVDLLDISAVDEVEGIIYPTSTNGVVGLILADKTVASGNALLTAASYGSGILLDVSNVIDFVDTKSLSIPLGSPIGFPGTGLLAGQVVRAQISSATAGNNGIIDATATNLVLRWSRVTGTVNTDQATTFTLAPPSYIKVLNPGLNATPVATTYTGYTAFDGIADASGITTGAKVSIRALFLNNDQSNFAVAKLRVP